MAEAASDVMEAEYARRHAAARVLAAAFAALSVPGTLISLLATGPNWTSATVLVSAAAYTGCFFLARRRHAHAAAALIVAELLTQLLSVVVNPHEAGPTGYFTVLIVFTSAATVGFRGVVLSSIATCVVLAGMLWARFAAGALPNPVEPGIQAILLVSASVIALAQSASKAAQLREQAARVQEARSAAEAARASELRFAVLADQTNDLVSLIAADGRVLFTSRSHERVLGITGDLLGNQAEQLLHPDDAPAVIAAARSATAGSVGEHTARLRHVDGTYRWFHMVFRRVELDGEVQLVVASRDVSEQRALAAELEESRRLESLGRLAGTIAHDFNNLLMIIDAGACLALDEVPLDSPAASDLEDIRKASERARALTQQLLAFARRQPVVAGSCDVGLVLSGVGDLLPKLAGPTIELQLEVEHAAMSVDLAPTQLEQILLNLVANARDAMPNGGTLSLRAQRRTLDGEPFVELEVSDTGVGIEPEVRPRIFEPFFSTKGAAKGTGLGLSTVYGLVRHARGRIDVDSTPGAGTTFRIRIPEGVTESGERTAPHALAALRGRTSAA